MAQFNSQEVRSSYGHRGKRLYYCYGDDLYAGTFPEEWAQDHAPGTGPVECEDCRVRGSWNGVFMLYCANCAINVYNGERGKGAISPGQEIDSRENREYVSAFHTYLCDVDLNDVGDTDFRDSLAEVFNDYASEFSYHNPLHVLAGLKRMHDELCCDSEDAEHVDYYMDTNGNHQDVSDAAAAYDEADGYDTDSVHGYDYDIAAATAGADYDDADYDDADADDHVSAVDRADNDYDYEGEYDRRRQCRDSRTVCYESDDLPRQQYIPSKGECVPNSFDNAAQEEEPDRFIHYGTGESWNSWNKSQEARWRNLTEFMDQHSNSTSARSNDKQTSPGRNSLHVQRFGCGLSRQRGYEFDDLSNDEDDDDERSFNTQDSVPEPDMSLNETVYCLVCENTKYNCACGDIDDEDNLDIVRKTHQFCLDYHINQDDEHAILRQLVDETLPTQNMDVDEAEPDDVPLDENVHCMICENTKYNCACDEDLNV